MLYSQWQFFQSRNRLVILLVVYGMSYKATVAMCVTNISRTPKGSRLTVVSREAKEEAASGAPTDSRLTLVSILQEQEL